MSHRSSFDRNQRSLDPKPPAGESQKGRHNGVGTTANGSIKGQGPSGIPRFHKDKGKDRDTNSSSGSSASSTPKNILTTGYDVTNSTAAAGAGPSFNKGQAASKPPVGDYGVRKKLPTHPGTNTTTPRHPAFGVTGNGPYQAHPTTARGSGRTKFSRGGSVGRHKAGEKATNSVNVILPPNNATSLTGSVMDSQMFPHVGSLPPMPKTKRYPTYNMEISNTHHSDTIACLYGKVVGKTDLGIAMAQSLDLDPKSKSSVLPSELKIDPLSVTTERIAEKENHPQPTENGKVDNTNTTVTLLIGKSNEFSSHNSNLAQVHALIESNNKSEEVTIKEKEKADPFIISSSGPGPSEKDSDFPNHNENQEDGLMNPLMEQQQQHPTDSLMISASTVAEPKAETAAVMETKAVSKTKVAIEKVGENILDFKISSNPEEDRGEQVEISTALNEFQSIAADTSAIIKNKNEHLETSEKPKSDLRETEAEVVNGPSPMTVTISESNEVPEEETIEATVPPEFLFQEVAQDQELNSPDISLDATAVQPPPPISTKVSGVISTPSQDPDQEIKTEEDIFLPPAPVVNSKHALDENVSIKAAVEELDQTPSILQPMMDPREPDAASPNSATTDSHVTPISTVGNLESLVSTPVTPAIILHDTVSKKKLTPSKSSSPASAHQNKPNVSLGNPKAVRKSKSVVKARNEKPRAPKAQEMRANDTSKAAVKAEVVQEAITDSDNKRTDHDPAPMSTELDLLASVHTNSSSFAETSFPQNNQILQARNLNGQLKQPDNMTEMELLQAVNKVTAENNSKQN